MALNILKAFAFASVRFQACSFSFRCGFRNAIGSQEFWARVREESKEFQIVGACLNMFKDPRCSAVFSVELFSSQNVFLCFH